MRHRSLSDLLFLLLFLTVAAGATQVLLQPHVVKLTEPVVDPQLLYRRQADRIRAEQKLEWLKAEKARERIAGTLRVRVPSVGHLPEKYEVIYSGGRGRIAPPPR